MALSVEKLIPSMPIDRNTAQDAWIELRDALAAPAESPDASQHRLQELYKSWTIRELNDYIIEDSEMLRNISYAYMAKSDMPYHSQLVEALRETSLLHLDRSDLNRSRPGWRSIPLKAAKVCSTEKRRWISADGGFTSNSEKSRRAVPYCGIWSGL